MSKCLSLLSNTRLFVKKTLRNLIFYTVAVVCLYPLIVFRHHILLAILYLYLWTNITVAVAGFLDELFDLPRKR